MSLTETPRAAATAAHVTDGTHGDIMMPGQEHGAAHEHPGMTHHGGSDQSPAKTPCDFGCLLCKTCSSAGMLGLPVHGGPSAPLAFAARYPLPASAVPPGFIGALPTEPPRV